MNLSLKMETWGCLCGESTNWEHQKQHDAQEQQTAWNDTRMDDNNTTRVTSEMPNCADQTIPPDDLAKKCRPACSEHNRTCKGETLGMVSDHVADMMQWAIKGTPTELWYKGQTSPKTNHNVKGHDDTKGASMRIGTCGRLFGLYKLSPVSWWHCITVSHRTRHPVWRAESRQMTTQRKQQGWGTVERRTGSKRNV